MIKLRIGRIFTSFLNLIYIYWYYAEFFLSFFSQYVHVVVMYAVIIVLV